MFVVGLTGGIGSGKSTVAKFFEEMGVPVFIADAEGKKLMANNESVKEAVKSFLGNEAYQADGKPNTAYIAGIVFKDKNKLQQLNSIIHPAVATSFKSWKEQQTAPYVLKEAAILFESGSFKDCDYIVTVSAPEKLRIERVLTRDNTAKEAVEERMKNQWPEEEKIKQSDYVIQNINLETTRELVGKVHSLLLKKSIST
ncbi:dephospho-CoA kinase [Galbibacter mesophilus]|uniref:dephospho-CoA kinase n=1 Tax=Galbibacter mesophilus TaxID=379069 RepID=UPI00191D4016|nr:dephospho-CoA kinase [Galbibacter mesophilus]MCM5662782.1 dephospho-CoA kinase [Galbibacter mesophilus]